MGIAFVPESLQSSVLAGVAFCPLADEAPELQLAMAWQHNQASPSLQGFLQIVMGHRGLA
ncbi:hypothetical protein [Vasconcelosia minhoensis]|uniref:hypothetical protein n=1 Tax=Vasconcelosia minhoensis TaxID=3366354 RepID=UPI001D14FE22